MDILVSFSKLTSPGRPAFGLLDAATSKFRVLQLPGEIRQCTGITGLAKSDRYVYAALILPPGLLVFDRADLTLLNHYVFQSARDIHSIWISGDVLYTVSTGTDEVLELRMRGAEVISEAVFWRPEPGAPRVDIHHVNAVYGWHGDLLVSGFGKKVDRNWRSANDGFIFNVTRGEKMASGIHHPHSLLAIGDAIAYCESREMAVRVLGESRTQYLAGYTRGLCLVGQKLFVGTSTKRRVLKRTRGINPADPDPAAIRCAVSRVSLDSFEIEDTIDLSVYADQIYDLLPVEDTTRWPVVSDDNVCPFDVAWQYQIRSATQELVDLVPPGDAFILVDDDQWATSEVVAGRRRIPFLERDGQYWGAPPDDATAIWELERLRQAGASFMVFGWPGFWWLDHYWGLRSHLDATFRRVLENERLVVFDLRP